MLTKYFVPFSRVVLLSTHIVILLGIQIVNIKEEGVAATGAVFVKGVEEEVVTKLAKNLIMLI